MHKMRLARTTALMSFCPLWLAQIKAFYLTAAPDLGKHVLNSFQAQVGRGKAIKAASLAREKGNKPYKWPLFRASIRKPLKLTNRLVGTQNRKSLDMARVLCIFRGHLTWAKEESRRHS